MSERPELGPIGTAAVEYARRGWAVIPLHGIADDGESCTCRMIGCQSPGKHPRVLKWQRIASSRPEEVSAWWEHYGEGANVGLVAGPSGLLIVDIDGPDGMAAFTRLTGGEVTTRAIVKTRRGMHLYYDAVSDASRALAARLRPFAGTGEMKGLDLRVGPSYVVAPPSRFPGGRYSWEVTG